MKRLIILILLFAGCYILNAKIIYVNSLATGNNDGNSWINACSELQDAIPIAVSGDTIVVARGVYKPHASSRDVYFDLINGVKIFGGFGGEETVFDAEMLADRDFEKNASVLSGDLNGDDDTQFSNISDNSYHVVRADGKVGNILSTTILDGFTIRGGNATQWSSPYETSRGGGILVTSQNGYTCSPTFANITLQYNAGNSGAAILVSTIAGNSVASPEFTNILIENNEAILADAVSVNLGAAIMVTAGDGTASPVFTGVIIRNNNAGGSIGTAGGIVVEGVTFVESSSIASPIFKDVVLCHNTSTSIGTSIIVKTQGAGALASPTFINTTVAGYTNTTPVYFYEDASSEVSPNFMNTIIWTTYPGNEVYFSAGTPVPTFEYSLVQGAGGSSSWNTSFGTDGGNNIDTNPMFRDTSVCNVSLKPGSPAVNTGDGINGDNIGYYQGIPLDISALTNETICQKEEVPEKSISIIDEEGDLVAFSVIVSDSASIPPDSVKINGSGLSRSIMVYPTDTAKGMVTIAIVAAAKDETDTSYFDITFSLTPMDPQVYFNPTVVDYLNKDYDEVYVYDDLDVPGWEMKYFGNYSPQTSSTFANVPAGIYPAVLESNGCFSDTTWFELIEPVNDTILEFVAKVELEHKLCKGDTTLKLEVLLKDDPGMSDTAWVIHYYDTTIIPNENIDLQVMNSLYTLSIDIPDSSGYYRVGIHAENYFHELANLYFDIYFGIKPVIDSIQFSQYNEEMSCGFLNVSDVGYYNLLNVTIDGNTTDFYTHQTNGICNPEAGEHTAHAEIYGCMSDVFIFEIAEKPDTNNPDTTGTDMFITNIENSIEIYPTIISDMLSIESEFEEYSITILNESGRIVYFKSDMKEIETLNVSKLASGFYILLIRTDSHIVTRKIVKN